VPIEKASVDEISKELGLKAASVSKVLELLLEEKCTIPFISRYRKEATGGLDEVQVGAIEENYNKYVEREKRRSFILDTIKEQGKLTKDLEGKIIAACTIHELEDLYAPYKSKRKTKGQKALEAGLGPMSELIKSSKNNLENILKEHSKKYFNDEIKSEQDIIDGVRSIISEEVSHTAEIKDELRKRFWESATIVSSKKKDAENIKDYHKYEDYFEFEQKISELKNPKTAHRFLALRRGYMQDILKLSVSYDEDKAIDFISKTLFDLKTLGCADFLTECCKRAYKVSLHSSLDTEIKMDLKLFSDEKAIEVFGVNLRNLLLQPYLGQKSVLGIDPGIRTGCKVAAIDKNGSFLVDTVIYPERDEKGSKEVIEKLISHYDIKYIAIGNGTYGRETLQFIKDHVPSVKKGSVKAMLVNEDGASIYSASEIARKEFPDKDLTVRGAISIARRFQDPLAELVKIDAKSIGVGQYQHDVDQSRLKKSLTGVVENCVNYVGVDLNTASAPLLSFISGIGPTLAQNIVKYRSKAGGMKNREELLKVSRFSPKVFEQSAGFLRIYGGESPLDGTFIHPERYEVLKKWCKQHNESLESLIGNKDLVQKLKSDSQLKQELGEFTLEDICKSLLAPSQDPRTEFVSFEYRSDATDINSIKVGQYYPGIVTNITQFGAFVDIGIKENGLIHISQIADQFVDDPLKHLKVGQEVKARVLSIDMARKRIALTLKSEAAPQKKAPPKKEVKKNAFSGLSKLKL